MCFAEASCLCCNTFIVRQHISHAAKWPSHRMRDGFCSCHHSALKQKMAFYNRGFAGCFHRYASRIDLEKVIQFDLNQWSLKYLLFIRWNMMINRNVHTDEAWHTSVSISQIYSKLIWVQFWFWSGSYTFLSLSLSPSHTYFAVAGFCWMHKFIYEYDNITTETYNVPSVRMRPILISTCKWKTKTWTFSRRKGGKKIDSSRTDFGSDRAKTTKIEARKFVILWAWAWALRMVKINSVYVWQKWSAQYVAASAAAPRSGRSEDARATVMSSGRILC